MQQLSEASSIVARFQTHRSLIANLVKIAMASTLTVAVWESLQHSTCSDEQLANLQEQWQHMDLIGAAAPMLEFERANLLEQLDGLRSDSEKFWQGSSSDPPRPGVLVSEAWSKLLSSPGSAWSDLTDAAAIAAWDKRTAFEDATWFLDTSQSFIQAFRAQHHSPSLWTRVRKLNDAKIRRIYLFSRRSIPSLMRALMKLGTMEAWRKITITAIALERFRLQTNTYPVSLADLVPDFLPQIPIDLMSGKSLRYERVSEQRFRLWSIGIDGIDGIDQGAIFPSPTSPAVRSGKVRPYRNWSSASDLLWPIPISSSNRQAVIAEIFNAAGLEVPSDALKQLK